MPGWKSGGSDWGGREDGGAEGDHHGDVVGVRDNIADYTKKFLQTMKTYRFYVDADTGVETLKKQIYKILKYGDIIEEAKRQLAGKSGDYRTITVKFDIENKAMSKLHAFLNGPVLLYYYRQMTDDWGDVSSKTLKKCKDDIKRMIKFFNFDGEGQIAGLASFKQFQVAKNYADKIETIREVVFEENGFLFPDSDKYNRWVSEHGVKGAMKLADNELKIWVENKLK